MSRGDETLGGDAVSTEESDLEASDPLGRRDTDPSSGSLSPKDRAPTDPSDKRRASTAVGRKPGLRDEHVGKVFGGKYRIDRLLAKGGMGRVYVATQFPLERLVAIKILNREFQQSDPQFVKRFVLEASIAAQLAHPHTITVFDHGESETGDLYIAMEYLKGHPLSKVLRTEGPYPAAETLRLATQICRALRAAHQKGIIHRDLKPGNIFILEDDEQGGYVKVLDFGLVKLFTPESEHGNALAASLLGEGDVELTRTGTLLGSPKYMSPEQIQGLPLDPRTDIYSLGIILYQMASGKAPFTGATGVDVIYKHVNFPVPPIATQNPSADCPPELEAIIRKCLEKKREDRYASMDAVLDAIRDAQKLITGASFGGDSMDSSASAKRRPAAQPRREVSFREPIADEPTPPGTLSQPDHSLDANAGEARPSRLPLAMAAFGFVVALATLAYVLIDARSKAEPPPPAVAATPEPALPPRPIEAAVEEPKIEAPAVEVASDEPELDRRRPKKKPLRPKASKAGEEPEEPDVELPPNYRENPY
jgi:serine/threonine-protein kinase